MIVLMSSNISGEMPNGLGLRENFYRIGAATHASARQTTALVLWFRQRVVESGIANQRVARLQKRVAQHFVVVVGLVRAAEASGSAVRGTDPHHLAAGIFQGEIEQ